ncbi:hypothetical protein [uncultured Corynebacterium sp.]|uniref:hypothetical protein n=1 Tax=uncultured Corynebacterium sp. TaxID=159447 RepID=UPI0025D48604|nr:hypothetical protein [uncultured Corynebacterium sp.]
MTVTDLVYVMEYRRSDGALAVEEFGMPREAIQRQFELEDKHRGDDDVEVATISAENLDAVKRTHSRYFAGSNRDIEAVSHVK